MTIDAFTETGSHTWNNPGVDEVEVLIVGGGGAGLGYGGGGGGGEVVSATNVSVSGDYTVTVGAGGVYPGYNNSTDSNWSDGHGDDSSAFGITAKGGGAGHPTNQSDISGPDPNGTLSTVGNGGGGSSRSAGYYGSVNADTSNITRYGGKRGGQEDYGSNSVNSDTNYPSGGGGGAGESITGDTGAAASASDGGDGVPNDILGTTYYWGGGGGGATYFANSTPSAGGDGGRGGGGAGSGRGEGATGGTGYNSGGDSAANSTGSPGGANTGGGGGAGSGDGNNDGANGGSGIVVVKYLDPRLQMFRSPVNVSANNITGNSADISWSDKSENENGFRVYLSEDNSSWTQESDLSSNTELYSLSGLENGEQYSTKIEAYNADKTVTDTTPINKTVTTSTTISEQNTTIVFANPETISGTMNVSNTKTIDKTTIIQL